LTLTQKQIDTNPVPVDEANHKYGDCYHYSGAIHFHTNYSDGSGTYDEVAKVAYSLGMKFIIPSDHDTVEPYNNENHSYISDVLVVPAVEISTDNFKGHFLVIGDDIPVLPNNGVSSQTTFNDSVNKGMMTFLAHVYHPNPKFDWHHWDIGKFTGMELFNLDSNWRLALSFREMSKIFISFVLSGFKDSAMCNVMRFPKREMKKFDELNMKRKVVGIGSSDAHARIKICRWLNHYIRYPRYKSLLNMVSTVIVSRRAFINNYVHDRKILLDAILNGNSYITFPCFGNATGFQFTASSDFGNAIMGETLKMSGSADLEFVLPAGGDTTVQIIRNGDIINEYNNSNNKQEIQINLTVREDGIYRTQVLLHREMPPFRGKRTYPWIISNPIYLERGV
jgi:hypothetical protein